MADQLTAPSIAILDENDKEKPDTSRRTSCCHIDVSGFRLAPEERKLRDVAYCTENFITQSMDTLVTGLLREQPPRPVRWCEQFIRTAEQLKPGSRATGYSFSHIDPREFLDGKWETADAPKAYIERHNIPGMFKELLAQLLEEHPADPLTFCLTWLRWNRHKFEIAEDGSPLASPGRGDVD
eukprot:RCo034624